MHKTYLGHKGYSIYKKSLSVKEEVYIREELMMKPYIPKSPVQSEPFPIYRESNNKFYIPRIFGINHFGMPNENRITSGIPINIDFQGELLDTPERNQINVVNKYMEHIKNGNCGGLLELYTGFGKTVVGLRIISLLKVKTIIIVHKGFLVEQWTERIQQFLPSARIGKIQGQIIDIEEKDIVIGMLQSLSMKAYPEDQFSSFGLTLVDEVHHMSAEVFVRSLQCVVTKYTLGLSATMNRKDGLSKVFKMFLGDIIHKEKRDNNNNVIVKAIEFNTFDEDFNTIEYDYRGNPKFSTMITKLCNFNIRSEYILNIIQNELKINNNQQIIVLAHNKSLLIYLYKAIEYRKITSVGYYLGGMKQKDLKISETKQIVIATYSMASEGLDIKTLTTLILATPKTDIEQSVGRILRINHSSPLIIDIVDTHDLFKKQWLKRRTFYHKNGYTINFTNNYTNNSWTELKKNCIKQLEKETTGIPVNKCLIQINQLNI
jgi:superfamily II DNA or RNA helicase